MEMSRVLVALGLALYTMDLAGQAFVPTSTSLRAPSMGAALPGALGRQPVELGSGSAGAAILAVAVGAATGVAATLRRTRCSSVQRRADGSYLTPKGPIVVYCEALVAAAAEKGESVPVSKDVMKVKKAYDEDEDFLHEMLAQNTPDWTQVDKAKLIVELLSPLESTVMPKFLIFLAKKKRLCSLKKIVQQYVQTLYISQSVAPVKVISASILTEEQKDKIKAKMAKKLEVDDIKLICEYNNALLGGFQIEYGYTDPDRLKVPNNQIDISLKSFLDNAVVKEGVVI